jgi:hypothetical protein
VVDVLGKLASEGTTMVMATHDLRLASKIAHDVVFLEAGSVVETGSAKNIFTAPDANAPSASSRPSTLPTPTQQILGIDLVAGLDQHFGDRAVRSACSAVSIFIASMESSTSPAFTAWPAETKSAGDDARHRRADMRGIAGLGLAAAPWRPDAPCARSGTLTRRGWPLSSKNTVTMPWLVGRRSSPG